MTFENIFIAIIAILALALIIYVSVKRTPTSRLTIIFASIAILASFAAFVYCNQQNKINTEEFNAYLKQYQKSSKDNTTHISKKGVATIKRYDLERKTKNDVITSTLVTTTQVYKPSGKTSIKVEYALIKAYPKGLTKHVELTTYELKNGKKTDVKKSIKLFGNSVLSLIAIAFSFAWLVISGVTVFIKPQNDHY